MKFVLILLALVATCVVAQNFGNELAQIDFANIIGGPLNAAVAASALSATQTSEFILQFGLPINPSTGEREVLNTEFLYEAPNANGTGYTTQRMTIPFLTLLPIPYLNIESMNIELNVNLGSTVTSTDESTTTTLTVQSRKTGSGWWSRTKSKASVSSKSTTSSVTVERDYKLLVKVAARSSTLPRGAERMLDLMESLIEQNIPV